MQLSRTACPTSGQERTAESPSTLALSETDHHGSWDEQLLALLMAIFHAGADNRALLEGMAAQPPRADDLPAARHHSTSCCARRGVEVASPGRGPTVRPRCLLPDVGC